MVKIQCISMEPHHCPAIDYILPEGKQKRKLHFKDRFSIQRAPLPGSSRHFFVCYMTQYIQYVQLFHFNTFLFASQ